MPAPSPEQKLKIGMYVGALTLVILIFWLLFLKAEINSKQRPEDSTFKDISAKFQELWSKGASAVSQATENLKEAGQSETLVSEELADSFAQQAEIKLWERRVSDWKIWENDLISFKYPASWFLEEDEDGKAFLRIRLADYNNNDDEGKEKPVPEEWLAINLNLAANPENLTAEQLYNRLDWSYAEDCTSATSDNPIISGQAAYRASFSGCLESPEQTHQLIYQAFDSKQLEILINYRQKGETQVLKTSELAEDFIKTIELKK